MPHFWFAKSSPVFHHLALQFFSRGGVRVLSHMIIPAKPCGLAQVPRHRGTRSLSNCIVTPMSPSFYLFDILPSQDTTKPPLLIPFANPKLVPTCVRCRAAAPYW